MSLPLTSVNGDPNLRLIEMLSRQLVKSNIDYDKWDRYYTGDQPLAFIAPEVAAQTGNRLSPMVINWPETIVDSVNRRLVPEGFRLGRSSVADEELGRLFSANGMDEDAPLGQADALVHGLAFLSVWGNDDDPQTPTMTFESAHQVAAIYEPGTGDRVMRAVLKRWQDADTTRCRLYLNDRLLRFKSVSAAYGAPGPVWESDGSILDNPLGTPPFAAMVNKGRLLNRAGRSELVSIAPVADGINKLATDMMVTSEFYQTPRRYATGIQIPTDGADRERLQAEAAAYWEQATKSKTWLAGSGVNFGQFAEADLNGFVAGINLLTSALAAIGGLPPDDLGLNTTNPASAEARRAAETTLILRAKEKQRAFGGAYVRAMRLAVAARDGIPLSAVPQEFSGMKVAWKDPATPAIAQAMDAAVKGVEVGIYDIDAAQEQVGLGPVERAAIKARAAEASAQAAVADVRARMALARELVASDGLTLNAAMAAAGLLSAAATNSAESASPAPAA